VQDTCCTTSIECNRCIRSGGLLYFDVGVCPGSGVCGVAENIECTASNPCREPTCNAATGCGDTPRANGTIVTGGVCCVNGEFVQGGVCCNGTACPAVDSCSTGGTCSDNRCPASACQPRNPCESAICNASTGSCEYTTLQNQPVQGGICCNGVFRQGGNCCSFDDCRPLFGPCETGACNGFVCTVRSDCDAPNPQCQTATCQPDGSCLRETECGPFATGAVGQGGSCRFGCQCQQGLVCGFSAPGNNFSTAVCRSDAAEGTCNFCYSDNPTHASACKPA
jgi:hypothetical protein